jgi:thiamine-phosphate pyrophosphorylase
VLDVSGLGPRPEARAEALFREGVDWIQLRDREATTASLLQTSLALVRARKGALRAADRDPERMTPRVILNRRVDIALAAAGDGVHLGFDAMEPEAARTLLGETALIGLSLHGAEEVLAIVRTDGADRESDRGRAQPARGPQASSRFARSDYAHLAPIWDPLSKPASRPALGLGELERACAAGLPILAQGGVDAHRAALALAAGAAGIAVTGQVVQSADPADAVRLLRRALDRGTA